MTWNIAKLQERMNFVCYKISLVQFKYVLSRLNEIATNISDTVRSMKENMKISRMRFNYCLRLAIKQKTQIIFVIYVKNKICYLSYLFCEMISF